LNEQGQLFLYQHQLTHSIHLSHYNPQAYLIVWQQAMRLDSKLLVLKGIIYSQLINYLSHGLVFSLVAAKILKNILYY
jgi:hypothetical protein